MDRAFFGVFKVFRPPFLKVPKVSDRSCFGTLKNLYSRVSSDSRSHNLYQCLQYTPPSSSVWPPFVIAFVWNALLLVGLENIRSSSSHGKSESSVNDIGRQLP
jgi:hypothetical protein